MPPIVRCTNGAPREARQVDTLTRMGFTISKAVIPAAGLGTRFLPATKAMPKEMLPVVDKPAIQYVVEEAVSAGPHRRADDHGPQQERAREPLRPRQRAGRDAQKKGDHDKLAKVNQSTDLADMHYVRQGDPLGLGHAVLRAKMHVGREPFAVLLGDDIIDARDPLLTRMIEVQGEKNATVVALLEVDPSQTHLYGIATVEETDEDDVVKITGLVEKPAQGEAPSQPGHHRPLRHPSRGLRRPREAGARQGRRDPAHRRAA